MIGDGLIRCGLQTTRRVSSSLVTSQEAVTESCHISHTKDTLNDMQSTNIDGADRQTSSNRRCAAKRTIFTRHQVTRMEERFSCQSFLSKEERKQFAGELCLGERQIMIWFQNRRGRLKRRGPLDKAYTAGKLDELTNRRPYPYIPCPLTTGRNSPVKLQPTRVTAWPVLRNPSDVTRCPAVTPHQDIVHPNVNMFRHVTPIASGHYMHAGQWVPCMVAQDQQQHQVQRGYNVGPCHDATAWSCNALRPNDIRFDVRQNASIGRRIVEPPQNMNMTRPSCSPGTAATLAAAESCTDMRHQTTQLKYFRSEPSNTVAEYAPDCFGVGLGELVHVW